jgi:hypothetical protein
VKDAAPPTPVALYEREYRRRRRDGEQTSYDVAAVRRHVTKLLETGHTFASIGRLAGCHPATVRGAVSGRGYLWRRTGEAILGVSLDARDRDHKVPAWRTQRLIAEMRRRGITNEQLSDVLRRSHKRGLYHLVGPERVDVTTERKFLTLYEYLARKGIVPADVLEDIA